MRVAMVAIGTRGDVQPLLALATGLQRAGHQVTFATEASYERAARDAGLDYYSLRGNSERFFAGPAGIAFRESIDKPGPEFRRFWKSYIAPSVRPHLDEVRDPCERADLVVCQPWLGVGPALADLGVRTCVASVFPVPAFPTREFPFIFSVHAVPDLPPHVNWRSWRRAVSMLRAGHDLIQRWRVETLRLAPQSFRQSLEALARLPHILGYSPIVVPKAPEWPDHVTLTGYWFSEMAAGYAPAPDLERFLGGGDPPVVIGFGSHVGRDPARLTRTVLDALRLANRRAILITAWGGLKATELSDRVFVSTGIPYDWLLPRARALVHHGGSGTTAIALRMGTPQLVTPFGYDQTFWGGRIAMLGVAPPPLPPATMTADALAAAIDRVTTDGAIAQRARDVGAAIRAERGLENAVAVIEHVAAERHDPLAAAHHADGLPRGRASVQDGRSSS